MCFMVFYTLYLARNEPTCWLQFDSLKTRILTTCRKSDTFPVSPHCRLQFSTLLAHFSQATRWRQGRNKVSTLVCLHFLQVISERSRSFSFISFSLSITVRDSPRRATVSVAVAAAESAAMAAVVGKLLLVVFVSETKPPMLSLRQTADDAADVTDAAPFSISHILNRQFERCAAAQNGSSPLRNSVTIDLHAQHFTTRSSPV